MSDEREALGPEPSNEDAGDGAREIGLRIQAIELGGLDQGGQHRPVLGAAIGAGEEAVLAT